MSDWWSKEMGLGWNIGNIWEKLTRPFSRFFHWIVKSVQYAWLLRKDFDWDYSFILTLLQYKLKRTRLRILKNNLIVDAARVATEIKHAEDLIQAWYDNNFCEDLQKVHDKKWGPIVEFGKEVERNGKKYTLFCVIRKNSITSELQNQEHLEQKIIYDKMREAEKKNMDELFSYMRDHIEGWWD